MVFNPISGSGVDAFYPGVFISDEYLILDPAANTEKADWCVAHPAPLGGEYHYHTASVCAIDASGFSFDSFEGDFNSHMETQWL